MDFKPIEISDKAYFKEALKNRQHEIINYNFSALFMFQKWLPYQWAKVADAICIKGEDINFTAFSPPITPSDDNFIKATEEIINWFKETGKPFLMTEVTQLHLDILTKAFPNRFKIEENRSGANYIYKSSDLAFLKGRKFSAKRNHIHHFFRDHPNSELVPLTKELIPACLEVMENWYKAKPKHDASMQSEKRCIELALAHFGQLDYQGACLMAGGKIAAFTLGEPLNDTTVAILVEKADYSYHGSFAVINSLFVQKYWLNYPYINRDEDLGDEGMRTAKQSYHPYNLNMKYILRLRED